MPLHAPQVPGLSSEQMTYSEFMRFMDNTGDGEATQQLANTWSELTREEPDAAAEAAAASASATNQEADWVRDFAEHKTQQG